MRTLSTALPVSLALWLCAVALAQSGPVLTGDLGTPPGTTGDVTAYAIYLSGDRFRGLTHGTLAASGTFTVTLPATVDAALLNPVDMADLCESGSEGVTAAPPAARHAMVMFVMWLGEESGAGAVIASSSAMFDRLAQDDALEPGDFAIYHLYAAEPFRLSGTCTVDEGALVALDIDAPAGWSLIEYAHGGEVAAVRISSITTMPPEARWQSFSD